MKSFTDPRTVKTLKITTVTLWVLFLLATFAKVESAYLVLSPLVALSACLLILSARKTQGHYVRISRAYAIGIAIWFVADVLYLICRLVPENTVLRTITENIYLIPNCFFALGLVLFMHSEYNYPHFMRVLLHTFFFSFLAFMIVQKLVLAQWGGGRDIRPEMLSTVLYFFVVVFNIMLVLVIFVQTKFKGHTMWTNLSAVALVCYNLCEMRMIYFRTMGKDPENIYLDIVYMLSLVIYALAQSDPNLINRKPEPDDRESRSKLKSPVLWINTVIAAALGIILYESHFFDSRDLYTEIMAIMAYGIVYKSIQTSELNLELLEQQKNETSRLEKLVEEKTKELQAVNSYLEHLSGTDALTGLYNRRYGMQKIQQLAAENMAVGAEPACRTPFALYLMDLNHFKAFNDNYGHDVGDQVLKEAARRLAAFTSEKVTVIRMGGDEFLILLAPAETTEDVSELAQEICRAMDEPFFLGEQVLPVSACIGAARFPADTDNTELLYQYADKAMYRIKHQSDKSSWALYSA